ncbi:MAG: peptidylprolyl isomerase [Alphaproteobacteria bacterium]|nr:peptidylprolyl isomerase [Alphaproteobacteria bacterium]
MAFLTSPRRLLAWFGCCTVCLVTTLIVTTTFQTLAQAQDPSPTNDISKVVATIDGDDITLNLVLAMMSQLPPQYRNQPFEVLYEPVLDDIIDTRLAATAAKRSGIADDPLIEELAQRAYDRVMAEAWISLEIQQNITDEMVEAQYAELAGDMTLREEISARHILVASEDEAKAIITRLNNGEDFAALAIELSTGPSAPNGGNLGFFKRGDMVPSFSDAAFLLEVESYSEAPVESSFGWHVIKVDDKRVLDLPPLDNIRNQLVEVMTSELATQLADKLYEKATIRRLSVDKVMAASEASE